MIRIVWFLILAVAASAEVRISVDPELAKSVEGHRGFTTREMREIGQLAERSVTQARAWLREPKFQEYFKKEYGLEPVKLLDETGMTVKVMSLTQAMIEQNKPRSGDYIEGTRSIRLHVREFYVAIRGPCIGEWVKVLATKVVHEAVHAAALDTGKHWEPEPGKDDEGTIAEKALGIHNPVAPEFMMDLKWLLHEVPPRVD